MPWSNPTDYVFTRESVMLYAPQQSGVYVLRSKATWVYVGEAANIRAQLIEHLNGDNVCIAVFPTLTFSYELISSMRRAWRHDELVREFRPICNPH